MNKLKTAGDVAELLSVPKSWVLERARTGEIPSVRLGKYVRFDLEDIESLLIPRRSLKSKRKCAP